MEFFSGLLLTLVVLGIIALVGREIVSDGAGEGGRKYLGDSSGTAAPMLGRLGTVVESTGELMRVRVAGERWSARPVAGESLPPGAPVRVTGVNGLVLDVEQVSNGASAVAEAPSVDPAHIPGRRAGGLAGNSLAVIDARGAKMTVPVIRRLATPRAGNRWHGPHLRTPPRSPGALPVRRFAPYGLAGPDPGCLKRS